MCNIPCSSCGKYSECKTFCKDNRCRSCVHDKEEYIKSPCLNCRGRDLLAKNLKDFFKTL